MRNNNQINLSVKNIVSKNLIQKRNEILEESFAINETNTYNELIKKHAIVAVNLINEGYDINEITDYIDKASNSIQDLTNTKFDYGQAFKDSMYSMAKEFAIKFILEYIGFSPSVSTKLGIALADLSYKDLLIPFKNREYCNKHLPNILDAILEVIIRDIMNKKLRFKKTKMEDEIELEKAKLAKKEGKKYTPMLSYDEYNWSDIPEIGLGNIVGDVIRKTPTSEAIANQLCKIIHE
jgi:hypothetical protein